MWICTAKKLMFLVVIQTWKFSPTEATYICFSFMNFLVSVKFVVCLKFFSTVQANQRGLWLYILFAMVVNVPSQIKWRLKVFSFFLQKSLWHRYLFGFVKSLPPLHFFSCIDLETSSSYVLVQRTRRHWKLLSTESSHWVFGSSFSLSWSRSWFWCFLDISFETQTNIPLEVNPIQICREISNKGT